MTTKRHMIELAGTGMRALEEKGRASEGAAGGAAGDGSRAGGKMRGPAGLTGKMTAHDAEGGPDPAFHQPDAHAHRAGDAAPEAELMLVQWKTLGAVAADIVARCQRARIHMPCA